MSEKKLTEEELAQASGGAQYTISSQKTENRAGLSGGAQGAALGGDPKQQEPEQLDNGQIAISGG